MTDWANGYVTDVGYTHSFFRELAPSWLNYVAVINGCRPRNLEKGFTHIDLGCGYGQSSLIVAGANPQGQFYGVDFNPAHIAAAQHQAAWLGVDNLRYIERRFEDLLDIDLPDFDFITLHGIYSWIGLEAREAIQRFIYAKLKPGGIVYNSYTCLPGWAPDSPIRRLLYEFGATHHGDSAKRVEMASLDAKALADLKQGFFRANPTAAGQIANLSKRQSSYLAHEYLNAEWNPFYSIDVADEMAAAKLTFVGSATLAENHLEVMLADAAQAFCRKQPTERLGQLVQDFLTGQRFRRDVFVRGHARLDRAEIARNLQTLCFAIPGAVEDVAGKAKVPRGEITFDGQSVAVVTELLGKGSASYAEIAKETRPKVKKEVDLERSLMLMTAVGGMAPAAKKFQPKLLPAKPTGARILSEMNRKLATLCWEKMERQFLASPVLGSGTPLAPMDALFLTSLDGGATTPQLTADAIAKMRARGMQLNKDSKPLTDPKEMEARMAELTETFIKRTLPALARNGVVELTVKAPAASRS
jgi:SAM-dependent methyltransferase